VSALVQRELQLHKFNVTSRRARLLDKFREDPTISKFFLDLAQTRARVRNLMFKRVSSLVSRASANSSILALFGRPVPGVPGVGMGSGGNPVRLMEQVLDVMDSDDFVREFTAMSGNLVDLGSWFNDTASGKMDIFLETTKNTSRETFAVDTEHFLRHWSSLELDLINSYMDIEAKFMRSLPESLFKQDDADQSFYDLGNMSAFAAALKNVTMPNMTGTNTSSYCPTMNEMAQLDHEVVKGTSQISESFSSVKRVLPTVGQVFSQMIPEDGKEAPQAAARLTNILGLMLNTSDIMLESMGVCTVQLTGKLAPHLVERFECAQPSPKQMSGAAARRRPFLTVVFSAIAAWLSAKLF